MKPKIEKIFEERGLIMYKPGKKSEGSKPERKARPYIYAILGNNGITAPPPPPSSLSFARSLTHTPNNNIILL